MARVTKLGGGECFGCTDARKLNGTNYSVIIIRLYRIVCSTFEAKERERESIQVRKELQYAFL